MQNTEKFVRILESAGYKIPDWSEDIDTILIKVKPENFEKDIDLVDELIDITNDNFVIVTELVNDRTWQQTPVRWWIGRNQCADDDIMVIVTGDYPPTINWNLGIFDGDDLFEFLWRDAEFPIGQHPSRLITAIQQAIKDGLIDEGEIIKENNDLLWIDHPTSELIEKAQLGDMVAWKNCQNGAMDHDEIYPIVGGDYKGKYLRKYALRYQRSPDYECELISPTGWENIKGNYII
jgi:hypothetical protein